MRRSEEGREGVAEDWVESSEGKDSDGEEERERVRDALLAAPRRGVGVGAAVDEEAGGWSTGGMEGDLE